MALGKYARVDGRRSSSWCSTVTVVMFVALCLVGVWMMTSSSVVPVRNGDEAQENKNQVKEQAEVKEAVSEVSNSNTRQFEDNPGDLPEDATKGDSNVTLEDNSNSSDKQEKWEGNPVERSSDDTKTEGVDDKKTEEEGSNTENESNSDSVENNKDSDETSTKESDSDESEKKPDSDDNKKSDSDESEKQSDDSDETTNTRIEEKVEESDNKESDENFIEKNTNDDTKQKTSKEVYPSGAQSELHEESTTETGSWSTQAAESKNEKESQESSKQATGYKWKLCNVTAGPDFIPCLDNWKAIRSLRSTKHYEHRERHCPEEPPTCLVPVPEGYKRPIEWPKSREKVETDSNLVNYRSLSDRLPVHKVASFSPADMVLQCSTHKAC